jgi:23S rRNA (uracil1939-C5)-methyltransferase
LHGASRSLAAEIKRGRIEQALSDISLEFKVDDIVFHPREFGYRQKVKLMAQILDGQLRLGVYVPYSHDFVVAENCPYVQPAINEAIVQLLGVLNARVPPEDLAQIKAVILRAGMEGVACVIVAKQPITDTLFAALSDCVHNQILTCVTERVHSEESNSIIAGERGRHVGPSLIQSLEGGPPVDPDSFCQSDPLQATVLYDLVAEYLTAGSNEGVFVDAYAGVGGFSRALQRLGATNIIAIEQSPSALSTLQQLGVRVVLKRMGEAFADLGPTIDGLVVDPPKKGLMEDASRVAALNAKRVVLVSCDPDAMARDLQAFLSVGYVVHGIIPVDLFGGTPAIETVVLMSKS